MRSTSALLVMLFAMTALGAINDDRFLERVDAYRADGSIEIVVGLTRAFRYVNHTLGPRGEVLRIQLSSVDDAAGRNSDSEGRGTLRWTGSREVPLDEVVSELNGNTSNVLLRFTSHVVVRSVRVDTDNRTVSVTIEAPEAVQPTTPTPKPEVTAPEPSGGVYVLNLSSARSPQSLEQLRSDLATDGRVLYQGVGQADGQPVYRLRLGFFTSRAQAQAVAQSLAERYPDAWVSRITTLERDQIRSGASSFDPARVKVRSDVDPTLPDVSLARLADLMEQARQAVTAGNAARAVVIYNRVAAYPVSPYREDARELLGVAHEKKGQLALAKVAYEDYLKRYPEGEGADRVRQRLAGLVTAAVRPRERMRREPVAESAELARWDVFGSFGQNYRRDLNRINSQDLTTTQSLLSNLLDVNARRRSEDSDLRLRFTGSYDHDFLVNSDSQTRVAAAYADYASRNQLHLLRAGRQTRSSGGVLGRFDGLYYGYKFAGDYRINLVTGKPVTSTADGLNEHQLFYGTSLDVGPLWDDWNLSLFAINQEVDSLTDRRAVGSEVRYFTPGRSLFGLLDYDVYFNKLNIFYTLGSWSLNDATSVNMVLDYRKSPLLSTSNALQGQTVTSIDLLRSSFTDAQLKQLAMDRTATSKSATAGVSHVLDSHWQVAGDATVTTLSGTPASGGVDATPSSGPDYYYNVQFVGSDLLKNGDLAIVGLRYSDTTSARTVTLTLNGRYPVNSTWRVNPRLRTDYRWSTSGGTQWTVAPAIRTTYVWKRSLTFELEAGAEVAEATQAGSTDLTEIYYFYAGYRYDF